MEDERILGVLAVQQRANELELSEINQLFQQEGPGCLLLPPGPYSDYKLTRSGDRRSLGRQFKESEVEVLE